MTTEERDAFIITTIRDLTGFMRLDCQVEIKEEGRNERGGIIVSVYTPESANFIIGKDGQSLRALELIVRLVVTKKTEGETRSVFLDINDYRRTRAAHALELARQAVSRVRTTLRAEALEPMSSYERRMVHMELASQLDVATESVGEEPQRRIVIKPFSDSYK